MTVPAREPSVRKALDYQLRMMSSVAGSLPVGVEPPGPRVADGRPIITRAEIAQCNCPDECERDHEFD